MSKLLQRTLNDRFLNTYARSIYPISSFNPKEFFKVVGVLQWNGLISFQREYKGTWFNEKEVTLYDKLEDTHKTSCPKCGSTNLAEFTSLNYKLCTNHDEHVKVEWKLQKGQKPLL